MKRNEVWKPVVGYDGLYEVSNLGRVKTLPRVIQTPAGVRHVKEKIRLGLVGKRGYVTIGLCLGGRKHTVSIHRLVLSAFEPNLENKSDVDHIDGNRTNNNLSNLRWSTRRENLNNPITKPHMSKGKREIVEKIMRTRRERNTCQAPKEVFVYNTDGVLVNHYNSFGEAGRELGVPPKKIQTSVDNSTKLVCGFLISSQRVDGLSYHKPIERKKKKVVLLNDNGEPIKEWESATKASEELGTRKSYLALCIRKRKRFKGYLLRYKN
jgi:hypothetical protein